MVAIAEQFDVSAFAKDIAKQILQELRTLIASEQTKDFYTTDELAEALGKSAFTIREHWCNARRIECEKDAAGKWKIPGREYRRLVNGGEPGAKR
jgi:response regulator of citrate/malate metabolism